MSDCIFCQREALELVTESKHCFAIYDKTPVAALHTLIIPRRCVATPFELNGEESSDLLKLAHQCSIDIATADQTVGGFNFGVNIGRVAGQKIMHVHFHLIPRRIGDIDPPTATQH